MKLILTVISLISASPFHRAFMQNQKISATEPTIIKLDVIMAALAKYEKEQQTLDQIEIEFFTSSTYQNRFNRQSYFYYY